MHVRKRLYSFKAHRSFDEIMGMSLGKLRDILAKGRHKLDMSRIKGPFRKQLEELAKRRVMKAGKGPVARTGLLANTMLYFMAVHNPKAARTWWQHWDEVMTSGYLDAKDTSLVYFACEAALNQPGLSKSAKRFLDYGGDSGRLYQALAIAQIVRSRLPRQEYDDLIAICMPEAIIPRKPEEIDMVAPPEAEEYAKAWFRSKKFRATRAKGESEVEDV